MNVTSIGNAALGEVLAEARRTCKEKGIDLTVIADGESVGFLEPPEIKTLMEAVTGQAVAWVARLEEGKRLIHLDIRRYRDFLMIQQEHYARDRDLVSGVIPEAVFQITEKYGGHASVGTRDGWFSFRILIPIPKTAE